jgi:hypothetical protein
MWRLRVQREAQRYLICAVSLAGLAASARFAIWPPQPATAPVRVLAPAPDRAAEGYAVLFTRRYLSWNASEPQGSTRGLGGFAGAGMEANAGLALPSSGEQRVEWAEVVQKREPAGGRHVYTVAAQTDSAGLVYLTVPVARTRDGRLALAGYPAFVGAPAGAPAQTSERLREVSDPALATVVRRALRNYLAGSAGELAADLSARARVSLPDLALSLQATSRLSWSPDGRSVVALVQAQDARGAQYTLEYEVDVQLSQGRWEVSAVQMDPSA